ncbi:OLC1v1009415C1 [Oldenlandia corymbosa var. corymbosa]|uniref:OLC1v1009415C1 n=1 Tax=Oldenlandia corymbosa var. corymbosa TaxID=529605 RepID=A0AAV1DNW8_OLDCO|nr:OLC1v1009415C1 [Oldenlandia corymbosa var. corymbosa]
MTEHHHDHHRPSRLSLPPRTTIPTTSTNTIRTGHLQTQGFPYTTALTPTPTPSKQRLPYLSTKYSTSKTSSLSFLFLLLFSLRSLYSLLPFLRSSPSSFSIFPFAFLVSLLSFLLTLSFSLVTSPASSNRGPFYQKQRQPIFSLTSILKSQHRLLLAKSLLLAIVFLLRFQALRYCGTAAMILAELSGNVAARFVAERKNPYFIDKRGFGSGKIQGFIALFCGIIFLSISWDRIECFPLSSININKNGFSVFPGRDCVRIWPMVLPFLSGFLGCYERVSSNWGTIREMGRKRVRLICLFYMTALLFIPALISMFVFEAEGDSISVASLGWPLANTVVFGVLLSENYTDEKLTPSKDFQKEYLVTFVCTVVLELIYFPELSLWGLLICGLLLWFSVRGLDPYRSGYLELGVDSPDSFTASVMKPVRHILSERKSRKIALFLLINTAYMVVEFVAGFMSNSLGLISDACHMLFDCAALAIGLYASYISRLPANGQFNYGRGRFEVLSGYVNAVLLVLVGALIVLESFERILDPQEISTSSLLAVSVGGLLVNVVGLIFFHEEHHHAHGGSGSCSHSHSHSHHHHDHQLSHNHDHHQSHHHDHQHSHDHDHHHSHDHDHQHSHDHDHQHSQDHDHHNHQSQHRNEKGVTVISDTRSNFYSVHDKHHAHDHDCHADENHHTHGSKCPHKNSDADHGHQSGHLVNNDSLSCSGHSHEIQSGGSNLHPKDQSKQQQGKHHHHIDHNMEGIFLHVLADTMGSVGVVVATLLIKYKGWLAADPACSIFISVLIVYSVIPLLRNSAEVLLQRVPRTLQKDLGSALNNVMNLDGVSGIQNLHVWSLTNTDVVGTLHLHVSREADKAYIKAQVSDLLYDAGIKDLTLQVQSMKE